MRTKFLLFCFILGYTVAGCGNTGKTVAYPPVQGLATSSNFKVTANGQDIWTEKDGAGGYENNERKFFPDQMEDLNVANFSCLGEQRISITASEDIQNYVIHPKSKHIVAEVKGRVMFFN